MDMDDEELTDLCRLSQDLRDAARHLTVGQVRYLVDTYYQVQQFRIEASGQERAGRAAAEPVAFVGWLGTTMQRFEGAIKAALDTYSDASRVGRWATSQVGIGPVLAAGLLAHIDISKARTAGCVWRFAGLDPSVTWEKKTKRPWNARLKVLCWKMGESFVKQSGRPSCYYGRVYAERKALEQQRNAAGRYATQAAAALEAKRYRAETVARTAYESGRLPDAHVHARAKRYAVKLFLSHYHHVAYEVAFGEPPPRPYVVEHLGHVDYVPPPGWPCA